MSKVQRVFNPGARRVTAAWFVVLVLTTALLGTGPTGAEEGEPEQEPQIDLESQTTSQGAQPGDRVTFFATIVNRGEQEETVTLQESSPWPLQVSFPNRDPPIWSVPANDSVDLEMRIDVDPGSPEGSFDVRLDALVNETSAANRTFNVHVSFPPPIITLDSDPQQNEARPGESVEYFLSAHNEGEHDDFVNLVASGPQEILLEFPDGDAGTVPAGETRVFRLVATVDEGVTQNGTRTLHINALARGAIQDSTALSLHVVGAQVQHEQPEETPTQETPQEETPDQDANETQNGPIVRLETPNHSLSTRPGGTVTFPLTIHNENATPLEVELRRNSDPQLALRMVGGVHRDVPANGTDQLDMEVTVQRVTEPGPRTVIVYAVVDGKAMAHLQLTVHVEEGPPLDTEQTPGPALAGALLLMLIVAIGLSRTRPRR